MPIYQLSNFGKMEHPNIIIFDGICNYCNRWVNFLIKRDNKRIFRFVPLQSAVAGQLLANFAERYQHVDSIIYIEEDRIYIKSTATLKAARKLGGFYSMAYGLIIVPRFIRDFFYNIIARNRYDWFGKKDACMVPDENMKDRFLA